MTKHAQRFNAFTFECSGCGCFERQPSEHLPEGWTLTHDGFGHALCPDCKPITIGIIPSAEELERESEAHQPDLAEMVDQAVLSPGGIADTKVSTEGYLQTRITPAGPDVARLELRPWTNPAFGFRAERQDDGSYMVAMQPWQVLTIWHPMLGFLLTPDQAERVADDLRRYAALARNPGSVGGAA